MRKTREILRLKWEMGMSQRQIAGSLNLSRSTVSDHLARAELAGLSWPLPEDMTDAALEELLFPSRQGRVPDHQPNFAYIHKELMKKGVTLELLWTEYKGGNPPGIPVCDRSRRQQLHLRRGQSHHEPASLDRRSL
jgi:hypothetical protein